MKMSSILKKALMAFTGLALIGFLVTHLAGNFQLFAGAEKFNNYAKFLEENPLVIVPAELILLGVFLLHIYLAITLTLENKAARPIVYDTKRTSGESNFASRTMMWTGFAILIFVAVHVYGFKYGVRPEISPATPQGSLWNLAVNEFRKPQIAGFYVFSMLAMGFHLSHGVASSLQSLGLRDASGRPRLGGLGAIIGWGLALGFASLPIWVFFFNK